MKKRNLSLLSVILFLISLSSFNFSGLFAMESPSAEDREVEDICVNDVEKKRSFEDFLSFFYEAVFNCKIDVIREMNKLLLDKRIKPELSICWDVGLYLAAQEGHLEVVQEIIRALLAQERITGKRVNINPAMPCGATPLCIAAQQGHLEVLQEIIRTLLEQERITGVRADINPSREDGVTPLHVAAIVGRLLVAQEIIRSLLKQDPEANINPAMFNDTTVIDIALSKRNYDIARFIEDELVDQRDSLAKRR